MSFGEKLRELRVASGLSQKSLAQAVNVAERTIAGYERGEYLPRNVERIRRIAAVLHTTVEELMGPEEASLIDAQERGGSKARRDLQVLSAQVSGLFAGGDVDEEDVEAAMISIQKAYWLAKEKNKKYTPKKYLPPADME